ncbi:MAG: transcription termination/antitermination NusG family protein [Deltaproteobacteria bacterium]|nr:transcription termination/antitermination NusG family protein [Deltaproteobacteria bacterium]
MENWFLAYTKPKSEDNVALRLTNAGFETMNPKIKEHRYYRRKITDIVSPLFPSYLFVKFDKIKDYHIIKYTKGIKWVLRNDSGPAEVHGSVIDSILSRMEGGVIPIKPSFAQGETVIIKGGPFEGLNAVFEKEMKGMERVSILLKTINVRLIVDGSMLQSC